MSTSKKTEERNLKNNLITARKNANLTQKQVAKLLNISERQYTRIEAGTSEGSLKVWKQLKALLNSSLDFLTE